MPKLPDVAGALMQSRPLVTAQQALAALLPLHWVHLRAQAPAARACVGAGRHGVQCWKQLLSAVDQQSLLLLMQLGLLVLTVSAGMLVVTGVAAAAAVLAGGCAAAAQGLACGALEQVVAAADGSMGHNAVSAGAAAAVAGVAAAAAAALVAAAHVAAAWSPDRAPAECLAAETEAGVGAACVRLEPLCLPWIWHQLRSKSGLHGVAADDGGLHSVLQHLLVDVQGLCTGLAGQEGHAVSGPAPFLEVAAAAPLLLTSGHRSTESAVKMQPLPHMAPPFQPSARRARGSALPLHVHRHDVLLWQGSAGHCSCCWSHCPHPCLSHQQLHLVHRQGHCRHWARCPGRQQHACCQQCHCTCRWQHCC